MATGLAATLIPSSAHARQNPIVTCPAGRFEGMTRGGIHRFLGIRYARAGRFRAPTAEPLVTDIRRATAFAPSAPQRSAIRPQSEDCLFLNIWTPGADPRARRPVMVYFHGGAYSTGSVTDPLNDGQPLAAAQDVVVVTVNHRLNALGYLYLARLDSRFPDSGNNGQLDLILALRWIRDNIAAFGGDPSRIMVFGQSGGGAKIATLMGMPSARGLFHSAATMSGQQVTVSGPLNATARARAFLARLRVDGRDLSPLLTMPVERLLEGLETDDPILGGGLYMGPVLDMKWLDRHPFHPDAHPQALRIPMILGNTRDETRAFFAPDHPKIVGLSWDNLAERMAPELRVDIHPEWVVAQYRARFPQDTPADLFYRATTAGRSWRGQVEEADARARAGARATWVYQLDFPSPVRPERGAPHTHDIPLVFGTVDREGSITGTGEAARRVSGQMMSAFGALARTGRPTVPGGPDWRPYRLPERPTMIFDTRTRLENDPRRWERELFARVPYVQPGT